MKAHNQTKPKKVRPRFGRETRFALALAPAAPFRGAIETELEQLKGKLLGDLLTETGSQALQRSLRRATNEAAALAWTTPFPLLVLPELVREKVDSARRYARRQAAVLRRTRTSQRIIESMCE